MPKASLRIAKSGGRDAALRRPVGAARRPYLLRRQDRRECLLQWRQRLICREIGGGIGFHNVKIAVGHEPRLSFSMRIMSIKPAIFVFTRL